MRVNLGCYIIKSDVNIKINEQWVGMFDDEML